ncbi:hypothetical protein MRX96_025762 [Rhipicephalus microplus]
MDPRLHQGRREARVEALERTYAHKNTTYYVDAANYDHANNKAVATVVDHTLTERTSASVRCRNITDAEETAIALALALGYRQRRSLTVLTDSQAACRNYLQGCISQPALSVIMSVTDTAENFEAATVAPGQTHRRIAASASWPRLKRRRMDALQETPRSPQEQPLVHTDEESATETTQMDVQTWSPQENEKLRCQIKEERREFHKIISSLETKLEARLNALEANNNATHAISRATVAHSLEGGTAKVDIPQRFSEEAHVSQLQMGEQLQSLRNLMRELQSQQQRAASELREQMMQQMHQMFSEYRKEFAAETEQQRRYVNDSVVGIQRAINKRVSVTSASSPLPKDRRITEKADTPQ